MKEKIFSCLVIIVFALLLVQFISSSFSLFSDIQQDFEVFYLSAKAIASGQNPYNLIGGKDIIRNAPPGLFIFLPLSIFDIKTAQFVWYLFSVLSFIVGSFFLFRIVPLAGLHLRWQFVVLYFSLVIYFFPFRYNLGSGQINNFLYLFLILFFYFHVKGKSWLSAMFLAFAIAIKLTPAIFLIMLLWLKEFRTILKTLVFLVGLSLLALLAFSSAIFVNYMFIPDSFFDFELAYYYNQSVIGVFSRVFENQELTKTFYFISLALGGLLLTITTKFVSKDSGGKLLFINILTLVSLMLAPFAWTYHFVIVIFVLVLTFALAINSKRSYYFYLLLAYAYLLTGWNIRNIETVMGWGVMGSLVLSHVFWGACLLLFLNLFLAFSKSKASS